MITFYDDELDYWDSMAITIERVLKIKIKNKAVKLSSTEKARIEEGMSFINSSLDSIGYSSDPNKLFINVNTEEEKPFVLDLVLQTYALTKNAGKKLEDFKEDCKNYNKVLSNILNDLPLTIDGDYEKTLDFFSVLSNNALKQNFYKVVGV